MIYGSVCSGIEAASVAWHPLGWKPAFFSEIEKFPRAVLQHHYPHVPLHGDFTTIQKDDYEPIDILVGGTPCQSFSIAGLRGGLDDERGNLALEFLRLVGRLRPRWILWENVPGVLSSSEGRDLSCILDGLEELGYIVDIDILDAQFYGVPQRRRRIFVCGEHRDHLIASRTDSSALTIAQCWQETLLGILVDQSKEFASGLASLGLASLCADGARRRMKLFALDADNEKSKMLRKNLVAAFQRSVAGQRSSDVLRGVSEKELTLGDRLKDSQEGALFTLTEQSLSAALAESYDVMKSFITSITTNSITQTKIYSCSQAALRIAQLILALNPSSPPYWSAASSSLIALKGYIDYARSAGSDLFAGVERFCAWGDFLRQAVPVYNALGSVGVGSFGEIFPLAESLRGDPAPRRKARETVAALTATGVGTCGADDNQGQAGHLIAAEVCATLDASYSRLQGASGQDLNHGHSHLVAFGGGNTSGPIDVATTVNACHTASGRQDFESETFIATTLRGRGLARGVDSDCTDTLIAHALRGEGFDASEDGTGRGTPIVPVAFALRGRDDGALPEINGAGDSVGALRSASGGSSRDYIAQVGVRRLTPRECERLQGFPDDYTLIPYRGKPAADGPRYKALGNSMAVPVMRWIGSRIEAMEQTTRGAG